jgi:hypothetical protein
VIIISKHRGTMVTYGGNLILFQVHLSFLSSAYNIMFITLRSSHYIQILDKLNWITVTVFGVWSVSSAVLRSNEKNSTTLLLQARINLFRYLWFLFFFKFHRKYKMLMVRNKSRKMVFQWKISNLVLQNWRLYLKVLRRTYPTEENKIALLANFQFSLQINL